MDMAIVRVVSCQGPQYLEEPIQNVASAKGGVVNLRNVASTAPIEAL